MDSKDEQIEERKTLVAELTNRPDVFEGCNRLAVSRLMQLYS